MKTDYIKMIQKANTLNDLDMIVELAAEDSTITNNDYADIYKYSLDKAKIWAFSKLNIR